MSNLIPLKKVGISVFEHRGYHEHSHAGSVLNIVYKCPCGKGKIYFEKDNTPGHPSNLTSTDCTPCMKNYIFVDGHAIRK